MRTIYLAMYGYNYEGTSVMRAFETKAGATRLVQQCEKHLRAEPPCPNSIEDTPENDALWETHRLETERWEKRAPKYFERGDFYSVRAIGFTPKQRNEERPK